MSTAAREHRIRIQRSARWYELGDATPAVREIWLVVHGYGQLARDFIATFEPVATGERLVVAPEALSRFYVTGERGGSDHHRAPVGATWMTREDRDAEILDYVDYLDAVVARARAAAPNAARLVALGFSQGTATVSRWAMLGAAPPDRLILWGGGPAAEFAGEQLAERLATHVEIVHGTRDRVVPLVSVQQTAEQLREQGAAIVLRTFDGGHRIEADVLTRVASE